MDEQWDARVKRLATPNECSIFERNARERAREDLAQQARHRWVELATEALVDAAEDADPLQRSLWRALAASEYMLGRSATGTRQVIRRRGLVRAAEQLVCNGGLSGGFVELDEAGLSAYAWEHVVLQHPDAFSAAAAKSARETVDAHQRVPDTDSAEDVAETGS